MPEDVELRELKRLVGDDPETERMEREELRELFKKSRRRNKKDTPERKKDDEDFVLRENRREIRETLEYMREEQEEADWREKHPIINVFRVILLILGGILLLLWEFFRYYIFGTTSSYDESGKTDPTLKQLPKAFRIPKKFKFDGGKMDFNPYENDSDLAMLQAEAEKGMQRKLNEFMAWAEGDVPAKIRSERQTNSDSEREILVFAELDPVTAATIPYLRENGKKLAQREVFVRMLEHFPEVKFPFLEDDPIVEPEFEEIWLDCFEHMRKIGREDEWEGMLKAIKGPGSLKYYMIYKIRVNSKNQMAQSIIPAIDTDFLFSCEDHEMMPFRKWAKKWVREKMRE